MGRKEGTGERPLSLLLRVLALFFSFFFFFFYIAVSDDHLGLSFVWLVWCAVKGVCY